MDLNTIILVGGLEIPAGMIFYVMNSWTGFWFALMWQFFLIALIISIQALVIEDRINQPGWGGNTPKE